MKSFCYWHLSLYLQKHNPNVPDIPNKLIKPPQRNGLTEQRKDFWDLVIHHNGGSVTSSPSMAHHFDLYFDMQVLGLKTVLSNAHNKNTEKLLQDYLTFIPDLADVGNLDIQALKSKFKDNIQPLITIASNNGFEFL